MEIVYQSPVRGNSISFHMDELKQQRNGTEKLNSDGKIKAIG